MFGNHIGVVRLSVGDVSLLSLSSAQLDHALYEPCASWYSAIWEVRTSLGNRIGRTLFAVDDSTMILLHGFIKKTQRAPTSEIALAEKRFKGYQYGKT